MRRLHSIQSRLKKGAILIDLEGDAMRIVAVGSPWLAPHFLTCSCQSNTIARPDEAASRHYPFQNKINVSAVG